MKQSNLLAFNQAYSKIRTIFNSHNKTHYKDNIPNPKWQCDICLSNLGFKKISDNDGIIKYALSNSIDKSPLQQLFNIIAGHNIQDINPIDENNTEQFGKAIKIIENFQKQNEPLYDSLQENQREIAEYDVLSQGSLSPTTSTFTNITHADSNFSVRSHHSFSDGNDTE